MSTYKYREAYRNMQQKQRKEAEVVSLLEDTSEEDGQTLLNEGFNDTEEDLEIIESTTKELLELIRKKMPNVRVTEYYENYGLIEVKIDGRKFEIKVNTRN